MADGLTFTIGRDEIHRATMDIRKFFTEKQQAVANVVDRYATMVWADAKENLTRSPHRVNKGTLRGSIHMRGDGTLQEVYTALEYAIFVHWGTGIHGINPKGGHRQTPWMYFLPKAEAGSKAPDRPTTKGPDGSTDGWWILTSGMKPNPFMRDAVDRYREAFIRDVTAALQS